MGDHDRRLAQERFDSAGPIDWPATIASVMPVNAVTAAGIVRPGSRNQLNAS